MDDNTKAFLKMLSVAAAFTLAVSSGCSKDEKKPSQATDNIIITETPEGTVFSTPDVSATPIVTAVPENLPKTTIKLPADFRQFDRTFAYTALAINAGQTKEASAEILKNLGFEILLTNHYDKAAGDRSHTCAYTIGVADYNGENLIIVVIRGTNGAEWYSNLDFAPSHTENSPYAENFYACAEDVMAGLNEVLANVKADKILVTGYSRGAAAANIVGKLVNDAVGAEKCLTYTFATPKTIRDESVDKNSGNIFNIINPNDLVPMLPTDWMGYRRLGTDVFLKGDEAAAKALHDNLTSISALAPDVDSYYNKKYALDAPGLDENGMSVYDIMMILADTLVSMRQDPTSMNFAALVKLTAITENSDLYPLRVTFTSLLENGGKGFSDILANHIYLNLDFA